MELAPKREIEIRPHDERIGDLSNPMPPYYQCGAIPTSPCSPDLGGRGTEAASSPGDAVASANVVSPFRSTKALVAIVKKRLNFSASLHEMLQILSLTMFEPTPLDQLLNKVVTDHDLVFSTNQLILFG